MKKIFLWVIIVMVIISSLTSFSIVGCKGEAVEEASEGAAEEVGEATEEVAEEVEGNKELDTVRVAMSAFQDVMSIYVGDEKGFFEEEGIDLDITRTDWLGANELLVSGHVEMATSCDYDNIFQNAVGQDTTLAFPIFFFAATAFMYSPERHPDWVPLETLLEETDMSLEDALHETLKQAKDDGAIIGVTQTAEGSTLNLICNIGGYVAKEDFEVVDMVPEDLLPALLSGSIDIMLSGIPQRLAATKEGYIPLLVQTHFKSIITHAGYSARREWVDENYDVAKRVSKGVFKTLDYIEKNPDEAFPIISRGLKESGTEVDAEDLKGVWNVMEFFANSPETYLSWVESSDSQFYWKDRYESLIDSALQEGTIEESQLENLQPLDKLIYAIKLANDIK